MEGQLNGWKAGAVLAAALASIPANIDVSELAGNQAENAIAINPTDPSNIVAIAVQVSSRNESQGLFEGVSFDGGRTWTRQVIGTGGPLDDLFQGMPWEIGRGCP
jgi:hypothetical protein